MARASLARLVMVFTAVAFLAQTYLTQTHLHFANASRDLASPVVSKAQTAPGVPNDRYPANEDPANCPICQKLVHASHFVAPAAVVVLLPATALLGIEGANSAQLFISAVTHIWHGRAPPVR